MKYFFFDLDGTLVDSKTIIDKSYYKTFDYFKLLKKKIKIGPSLDEVISENLSQHNSKIQLQFKNYFIKTHDSLLHKVKSYPNVEKLLLKILSNNSKIFILTNKRYVATSKIIDNLGWSKYFDEIICKDKYGLSKKEYFNYFFLKHNSEIHKKTTFYFISDTLEDYIATIGFPIKFIRVTYGYGNEDNWPNDNSYFKAKNINEIIQLLNTI